MEVGGEATSSTVVPDREVVERRPSSDFLPLATTRWRVAKPRASTPPTPPPAATSWSCREREVTVFELYDTTDEEEVNSAATIDADSDNLRVVKTEHCTNHHRPHHEEANHRPCQEREVQPHIREVHHLRHD